MFLRKEGEFWYVCRRTITGSRIGSRGKKTYRNWWLIKWTTGCGFLSIGLISIPQEFIGKKIVLKVEVIE